MDWLVVLLCLGFFCIGVMQLRAGFKHRNRFRQEGRETHSLLWHVKAAADELKQAEKARKSAARSAKEKTSTLDRLQSDNRAAAKAAVQARRESQPKKKRSYHAGPSTRPRAAAPIMPVMPGIRRVAFDYMDQAGNISSREVTAERYHYGKLYAHCHLRRAQRTFFLDSIIGGVVDTRTGEVMDKQVWAETLY